MNRCALYARFSSDNQKESSIEDQLRNCRSYAEKQGFTVSADLVFKDEAISGSISNARPGYQSLMKAVNEGRVGTILVDSLERISRDQEELHRLYKQLRFRRITLIGVADGYNGDDKLAKVNLTVKGLMAEMFLDDLKEKTHRGLEGVFLNGRSPGGAPYGYRSSPIFDPIKTDSYGRAVMLGARKEIEPQTAEIVQKIFHMFAEGYSTKQIAHHLNELGIPSPRGKSWSFSTIKGDPKKALGILNNPIYIGKPLWNRTEWLKNPATEKRVYKKRAPTEWIEVAAPDLRIISDEIWAVAKERQENAAKQKIGIKTQIPKYLLSGLLYCSACGCSYIMQRKNFYYCSGHLNRGNAICTITGYLIRDNAELTVINALSDFLLQKTTLETLIDIVRTGFEERMSRTPSEQKTTQAALQKSIEERENIMNAIKAGVFTPTTKQALQEAEAKIARHQALLTSLSSPIPQLNPVKIAAWVENATKSLNEFWKSRPVQARDQLRQLVDRIVVERAEAHTNLRINGTWETLLSLGNRDVDRYGCGGPLRPASTEPLWEVVTYCKAA